MSSNNIARQRLIQASRSHLPESSNSLSPGGVADQPSGGRTSMAPGGHGQQSTQPPKGRQSPERQQQQQKQQEGAMAVPSNSAGPVVLSAIGQAARTGWTALQLCHRYVIAPAAIWALRALKEYIDEQIAIARAMSRPCPLPRFNEAELMAATGQLGPTARLLDSPYGLVSYAAELRGQRVVVRQTHLGKLADVDAFWTEAAAGRAALAAGGHPHVVSYIGCCPSLACHIYQRPTATTAPTPSTTSSGTTTSGGCCSLREALAPGSPHSGSLLGSWEVRLALCEQLAGAGAHLLRAGITASDISSAHVLVQLHAEQTASRPSTSTSTSGGGSGVPHCWLAPGCGFGAQPQQLQQAQQRSQQHQQQQGGPTGGEEAGRVADMALGLGQLLMQVLGPPNAPTPAPATVLEALSDLKPTCLLSPTVAPPLIDDQVWPLLAALYPLLAWGQGAGARPPAPGASDTDASGGSPATAATATAGVTTAGGNRGGSGSAAGCVPGRAAPSTAPGSRAATLGMAARNQGAQGQGQGQVLEPRLTLQAHLLRELIPTLAELRRQLHEQAATVAASAAAAGRRTRAGGAASSRSEEGEDAFAGASAPPMPMPVPGGRSYAPSPSPPAHGTQGAVEGSKGQSGRPPPPPDELCCPITHELMDDPVVAADGHSYERSAIARWFAGRPGRPTSPLTGAALPGTSLTPNYALRKIIQDWRTQHAQGA